MTDLVLAIAHHLLIFALVALLAALAATLRPGLTGAALARAGRLDAAYGGAAGLLLVVGAGRVFLGGKGAPFYLENPVFWAKIAAFVCVGLLSVPPTRRLAAWRRAAGRDPSFTPSGDQIRAVRRFIAAQAAVFVLIPVFAAAMARGYGL